MIIIRNGEEKIVYVQFGKKPILIQEYTNKVIRVDRSTNRNTGRLLVELSSLNLLHIEKESLAPGIGVGLLVIYPDINEYDIFEGVIQRVDFGILRNRGNYFQGECVVEYW